MHVEQAQQLALRIVSDMGGAFTMALAYIGDRLGIYQEMRDAGPVTSEELASRTGLQERYVREWLRAMVASEYLDYDPPSGRYLMTPEQAAVLADEDSPFFVGGGFQMTAPSIYNTPQVMEAFRNGGGVSYHEMHHDISCGIERVFRPGYVHFLTKSWIPSVEGLQSKLEAGALAADIGCGRGQSTIHMAKAFQQSSFIGVDYHAASIAAAERLAAREGVRNAFFVRASAENLPSEEPYDLISTFDCIHDMPDPQAAADRIHRTLADDGVWLWSEPNASHEAHENRNPIGRHFHAVSPMHCMTVSLAAGGAGLGTVIGEKGAREIAEKAGFRRFERLPIEDPFNQFFAVRK